MELEKIYEEVYASLEKEWQGRPCPSCGQAPRTHIVNVIPLPGRKDVEAQTVCQYTPDGRLKEVFRRMAWANKRALRETFGNILLEDGERSQRLEEFVSEHRNEVAEARRLSARARMFEARVSAALRQFAETLGVPTASRGQPRDTGSLLAMTNAAVAHLKKRAEEDQALALRFYTKNQELVAEIEKIQATSGAERKVPAKPQLRVVGSPPPIPTKAKKARRKT